MKQLSKQSFEAAQHWLIEQGRTLEHTLFSWRFEGGSVESVLEALAAYQNTDGGYGHRLEPDHTDDGSTVLNTTIALGLHRLLGTASGHEQIEGAIAYLLNQYRPEDKAWLIRSPVLPGADGPPWFMAESEHALMTAFGGCRINPSAEVLGYLFEHAVHVPAAMLESLVEEVGEAVLPESVELGHHDLMCAAQLLGAKGLSEVLKSKLRDKLMVAMPEGIETDPEKWGGYVLRPTQIIDGPDHVLATSVPQSAIDADLDFEAGRQNEDGAWLPFWGWSESSEGWPAAERAWKSVLTERTLRVLGNLGRVPCR